MWLIRGLLDVVVVVSCFGTSTNRIMENLRVFVDSYLSFASSCEHLFFQVSLEIDDD